MDSPYGKNAVLTVPNAISFARLLLVPLFLWFLLWEEHVVAAGVVLALIGGTDWIDGFIARKFNQTSELGEVLDPIADRFAIVAALLGGMITGIVPWWFTVAILVREVIVVTMVARLAAKKRTKIKVRFLGKLATFLLYVLIALLFLTAEFGINVRPYILLVGINGLVLYYVAAGQYAVEIRKKLAS